MNLVLDTNVLIAAFLTKGVCHDLLEHCQREHRLVTSAFILNEFEEKLRDKFKIPENNVQQTIELLRSSMQVVSPPALANPVCRDADDDWILATALIGGCDCIITGDNDLLEMQHYQSITILPPSAFWAYEAKQQRV